ncbi:hypothetical protein OHAE_1768 [Ochrobactrum soli]|uniref:Uncharacterized protein n=1 Tax=Ochrobactrum soli TaxID=2448455 RepID=A0A2P9HPA0_9HYPH|nr:hypothetical protein OHAE_1768 [[Ochrobactrum] soli]
MAPDVRFNAGSERIGVERPETDIGRGLAKKSALKTLLCLFV